VNPLTPRAGYSPYVALLRQPAVRLVCYDVLAGFTTAEWLASTETMCSAYRGKEIPKVFLIELFTVHDVTHATYRKMSVSGICGELEEEPKFHFRFVGTHAKFNKP